jgi:hypothetical protein
MNKLFLLMGVLVGLTAQAQVGDEPHYEGEPGYEVRSVGRDAPAANPSLEVSLRREGISRTW